MARNRVGKPPYPYQTMPTPVQASPAWSKAYFTYCYKQQFLPLAKPKLAKSRDSVISHLTWEWMVETTHSKRFTRPKLHGLTWRNQLWGRDAKETQKSFFCSQTLYIFNDFSCGLGNSGYRCTDTLHFNVRSIADKIGKTWVTKRYVSNNDWLLYSQICNFTLFYE